MFNRELTTEEIIAILRYIRSMQQNQQNQGMLNLAKTPDVYYPQPIYMPPSTTGTRG